MSHFAVELAVKQYGLLLYSECSQATSLPLISRVLLCTKQSGRLHCGLAAAAVKWMLVSEHGYRNEFIISPT